MKNIYILPLILFIISCGEKVSEEITDKYDNGNKMRVERYYENSSGKEHIEKIGYLLQSSA